MSDFSFLQNPYSHKWIIAAPRRAKRPDQEQGDTVPVCPFCPGRESVESEVFRMPERHTRWGRGADSSWLVRVIPNKFPFAETHEIVISSPDHHKGLDELPLSQLLLIFQTYRQRFNTHREKGSVYIFHNAGAKAGESMLHPHSQLVVIPQTVQDTIPGLINDLVEDRFDIGDFSLFCPKASQWPDEVWLVPNKRHIVFGDVSDEELGMLTKAMQNLINIMALRHGDEFPYNFYIYPRQDWYVRLIPRLKTLGGLEVGTGIFVNTQDPKETMAFLREHFHEMNIDRIRKQQARYHTAV